MYLYRFDIKIIERTLRRIPNQLIIKIMYDKDFSDYVNHIAFIRRNINCLTYREQDGTAIFVLVCRLSSVSYISLRSPSSMVLLHVDNEYPQIIGYADNREQFAIAVYEHLAKRAI